MGKQSLLIRTSVQVGLAAHSASDPSLRGLDAFVGEVGDYAGTATNEGLIQALRGSGVAVEASGTTLWEIRDGRVDRFVLYQSREEALKAAGLSG